MKLFSRRSKVEGRAQKKRKAFTLIEILLAIAIFMLAMGAIYSMWFLILRATQVGKESAAQMQRQRIAIEMIQNSLASIQSYQASMQYYSFILENGEAPMLQFTARVPDDFPRHGRYGDFSVRRLIFSLEPVTDITTRTTENDLVLRQYPILTGMEPEEQATPYVLARNVEKFYVECWDTNLMDWTDEWLETNSIPSLLRVNLVLGEKKTVTTGTIVPSLDITRVLAVPSQTLPASAQTPGRNTANQINGVNINFGNRRSGGRGGGQ